MKPKLKAQLVSKLEAVGAEADADHQENLRPVPGYHGPKHFLGEALPAIGELASGMAHHLNNLLSVILIRTQLLLEEVEDPEIRGSLKIVEQATADGIETVRRVRTLSRAHPASEPVPVDLNRLVQEVLELTRPLWQAQAQARGIEIQASVEPGDVPKVTGDPAGLREVLMNLLLNAVDAMPRGGRITVRTWASGKRVHCSVADTGVGMSEEVRRRALEPFFTTKGPKNTGLGLSINSRIIRRHGGELTIESAEGQGTAVTFSLKAASTAKSSSRLLKFPGPFTPFILAHNQHGRA